MAKKTAVKKKLPSGEPVFGLRTKNAYTAEIGVQVRKTPGKWIVTKWKKGTGASIVSNARLLSGLLFEGNADVDGIFWVRVVE